MPRRALLSVSDKTGIVALAQRLLKLQFTLISTGGTKKALEDAGIAVTGVEEVTGFPECFGGRVKTMHPMIMGGILFRREEKSHQEEAKQHGIEPIDLVVVNLYPFARTAADPSKSQAEVIEQIDIGGPTLLRSAAKNAASVTVLCDPADYDAILREMEMSGDTSAETRSTLASKAFLHTAAYDSAITAYLSKGANGGVIFHRGKQLRYGENPHQWGKYYELYDAGRSGGVRGASDGGNREQGTGNRDEDAHRSWTTILQGKEMSYLNILDADAAWAMAMEFEVPTAVMVKHANPSGIASHESIEEAFQRAYDTDRISAFGVIIALNRPCTAGIAQKIIEQKIFTEVVVAPSYEQGALDFLKQKPNIRVIEQTNGEVMRTQILYRSVKDGMLVQDPDARVLTASDLTCVTDKKPTPEQIADLLFAWKVVKYAKSNAIVLAKDAVTVGIGSGQTSRVDSTWIALKRAGDRAKGSVLASDAFFPFPDSIEEAAKQGIAAVIQPGGSVKDAEVFARANELGICMVTTGVRAFRH